MNESTNTYSGNFSFTFLIKYKPGTDLMSKLTLDDKRINNIIVSQIIGQYLLNQYVSKLIEWLNFKKSDVLYTSPNSKNSNSLLFIVVKVQYTGNMSFCRRLIDYGLSVTKRHSASLVILAIIIHNTTTELTNLSVASEKLRFLLELPCYGWAESCYLLNSSSISDQLQLTSLNPLVALRHFLIQQKGYLVVI
ncbi:hypothetical protein K501DRAFT_194960 [Backusella circina FSU 941]|nr:hypothetical protein K501DRAFT_194960 [Backusella circina FSU 941]